MPQLYSPTAEYEQLLLESIAKLWHLVVHADDHRIKVAALNALQHYDVSVLKLADMPEDFRQNIALPTEFLKALSEGEPAPDPVDVLTYVPSECWLQVLQFVNHSASEAASDLVAHHIRTEVSAFKSGVYTLPEGHPEPKHVNRLSRQSPLKAVLKFLLAESQKASPSSRNRHLTFFSLRSISFRFANPMPALHWSFLVEFMQPDEPEMTQFCLQILANQMQCSASAVQTIESYVISSMDSENKIDLDNAFVLLPTAAQWISDDLLYRWTEFILVFALKQSQLTETTDQGRKYHTVQIIFCNYSMHLYSGGLLDRALDSIATLFANPSFNKVDKQVNYNVVIEVLCQFYGRIDASSTVWSVFQKVCRHLPNEEVNRITVAHGWANLTEAEFLRALSVRCDLVQHSSVDKSWFWLKPVVDNIAEHQMYHIYINAFFFVKIITCFADIQPRFCRVCPVCFVNTTENVISAYGQWTF